jgi:hypothetical protein
VSPVARNRLPSCATALLLAGTTLATGCGHPDSNAPPQVDPVKRGEILVRAGACNDCHTPMQFDEKLGMPVPIADRMLSGHPEGAPDPASGLAQGDQAAIGPTFTSFRLPFGVSYTANLTPDVETGLGKWSEEQFLVAMRTGQHMGVRGRPILPPMPWMSLKDLPDDDLKAIWAYLQSVPAVRNRVPEPKVAAAVYDEIAKSYAAALGAKRP